jgi:ABC-type antimicrobial peptide transport system permease subunit
MYLQVKIAPGVSERAALDALRADLQAVDPDFPVMALSTMRAFHEQGLELWALKIGARMFTALGSLALLLAVIGVYGVKSYVVAQRTREIGIRMALGATAANVRSMVLRDGLVLTTIGLAVGIPLALLVSVALTKVFVEVGGIDAVVIASGALALFLAATAATAIPARRATRVVPLRALRNE